MMDRMPFEALVVSPLWQITLVGVAGIIVWLLIPSWRCNIRLVVQIAFFAVMTAIFIGNNLTPFSSEAPGVQGATTPLVIAAKLLWWTHLAWAIIGFVRIYLVLEERPREARLLQDVVVGVVYLGVALSILAFVFGIPIGTLVATSGVVAIILGLALQNTLSDVFSGIALTLGRPYVIGDWIALSDGIEGRVVESNWRSTQVLTGSNNVVVLPNSFLARLWLTNVSRPDGTHLLTVTVRIAPTRMPSVVVEAMQSVLLSCTSILAEPPPTVALKGLDALALEVDLQFAVASLSKRTRARNEVLDLVYRHCKSAGLLLAMPPESRGHDQSAHRRNCSVAARRAHRPHRRHTDLCNADARREAVARGGDIDTRISPGRRDRPTGRHPVHADDDQGRRHRHAQRRRGDWPTGTRRLLWRDGAARWDG